MKKILLSIASALMLSIGVQAQTAFDYLESTGEHTELLAAFEAANFTGILQSPTANNTVFAPTDAAFPDNLLDLLESSTQGEDILSALVFKQVVAGEFEAAVLTDGLILSSISTSETITVSNDGTTISVNGAVVTGPDNDVSNGIVHVVDAVLLPDNQSVFQRIQESADHALLEQALIDAQLNTTLEEGPAFTVFAPTDDAFGLLPAGLLDNLLLDPEGVLAEILLNHVVEGIAPSSTLSDGQMFTSLFGESLTVDLTGGVFINGAEVTVADIPAANGVVHVIDAVLVPAGATTVLDIVVNSDVHMTLEAGVIAAELDDDLQDGEALTVFAPTDAAFDALPAGLLDALLTDPTGILANVLLQHMVGSTELSTDLTDGLVLSSLLGQDLTVTNSGVISINGAFVTTADLIGINGVVHVIDAVIIPDDQTTVYDVIADSPDHTTLLTAVDASGLDADLQNGTALTVFAPTDDAFNALPANMVTALLTDPTGVLTEILQYHVVASIALSDDLTEGQLIGTLFGENVTIGVDGGVTVNGANVTVADIPTINGVVHVIDAVLVPEGATTVVDIVVDSPDHTTLETAVGDAGLVDALSGDLGEITLFAPTDDAFDLVNPDFLADILADPTGDLVTLLQYHVVPGFVLAADLTTGDVTTLQGETVSVDVSSGVVLNGTVTVTVADLVGVNGIVHVVDAVLVPAILNVDEIDAIESLSVFPNPANNVVNLEMEMITSERITIDFVNMLGQVVKTSDLGQRSTGLNREVIDVDDMVNGFYMMNITIGEDQLTQKVQVVR